MARIVALVYSKLGLNMVSNTNTLAVIGCALQMDGGYRP